MYTKNCNPSFKASKNQNVFWLSFKRYVHTYMDIYIEREGGVCGEMDIAVRNGHSDWSLNQWTRLFVFHITQISLGNSSPSIYRSIAR